MNKKTKIFTISVTCASLVFVPTLTSVSIILNSNKIISNAIVNSKLNFMDQDFETKQDVLNYANSISQVYNRSIKTPVKWSINANGETLTFDNQKDIYNYLETNFITKKSYTSYTNDFLTDSIGAILPSEMPKMNFSENTKTQTIYRGKNNSIYLTEKEAKDTYLQAHEVYYFNGIFFRSKEELSNWLEKNIMNIKGSKDLKAYEISLKDPNGGLSLPMKIYDLKKDFANNITPRPIESFVKTNSKPYFKYKNDNNEDAFVSEKNVNKLANNYDASYVNLISNQGKGNYIVDTAADDKADLIGPYYVKSGTEILQITDKTKWRKIEGKDHAIVDEMVQSELISQFMNLILFSPPNDLNNPKYNESNVYHSKNALYTIPILQEEINTYFDDLYSNFRVVYNSVKSLHDTMSQGKKYGEFLKTPVLFVHTIDQIIYYSGDQEFIDKTREIYTKICNHFDKLIYSTIPKKFLKSKNNKYFSIKDLFKVDNLNLDLNYDIDTLISEIVYEYPALYECIQFICNTEMYLSKLNTLEDISFSTDFYLSAFNLKLSDDYIEEYKLIWNILNSKNYDTFFDNV
ncbi:MAG: hypothetical protein K2I49_02150, partial [Ureaplasma sp.]|nr:hypothetical protein [Ureaplasma sp.]